jgi:hypothetical protein
MKTKTRTYKKSFKKALISFISFISFFVLIGFLIEGETVFSAEHLPMITGAALAATFIFNFWMKNDPGMKRF